MTITLYTSADCPNDVVWTLSPINSAMTADGWEAVRIEADRLETALPAPAAAYLRERIAAGMVRGAVDVRDEQPGHDPSDCYID